MKNKISCVGNGRFFYFGDYGKLELLYIQKEIFTFGKICTSVLFIECTEIIWKKRNSNRLFVSIFIKYMEWYLVVIGKLHNEKCLINIFTVEVLNGNPNIFTNS